MPQKSKHGRSWKQAFLASPGPKGLKESFLLLIKGLCMGSADIVPGVSGGTIALITGIYTQLLQAIQSVNAAALKSILQLDFKKAISQVHIRFLLVLLLGIGIALISLARVMNFLLREYPVPTWSLFLGLVAASIFVVGKNIKHWRGTGGISFVVGAIGAYFLVGMIPVQTPEAFWFIFLSGMIAICAMILPGISGSFFLLILGKYEFITGALKNPFAEGNFIVLVVFACGCLVGILGFSRILSFLLSRYYNITLAVLTGLMFGSMRKIWPWKETLETVIIRNKPHVLREQNILPPEYGTEFFLACFLALVGIIVVLFLQKISQKK